VRDPVLDSCRLELRAIDGAFHQKARTEDRQATETSPPRLCNYFFGDMHPWQGRVLAHEIKSLVNRIVGADQQFGSGPHQARPRVEQQLTDCIPASAIDQMLVTGEWKAMQTDFGVIMRTQ